MPSVSDATIAIEAHYCGWGTVTPSFPLWSERISSLVVGRVRSSVGGCFIYISVSGKAGLEGLVLGVLVKITSETVLESDFLGVSNIRRM